MSSPSPQPPIGAAHLRELLFHEGLTAVELKVWAVLRAEPMLGVCAISARVGHHRKSVAGALRRLVDLDLAREVSPTPERRDPSTGQLVPKRYVALDPPSNDVTEG